MLVEATFVSAFLVGLLGGVHCLGMCGGVVGVLAANLPPEVRGRPRHALAHVLAYNLGRIATYMLAGGLMGGVGVLAANMIAVHRAQLLLQLVAGAFMVALGLYLAGWWGGLRRLERAGSVLWRRLEPLGRGFLPPRRPAQAFVLGLVWGWLPCGLVYSVLIWSVAAGSVVEGALLMLGFGLGTLPLMTGLGISAARLAALLQRRVTRVSAGLLVALFGGYMLWIALRAVAAPG